MKKITFSVIAFCFMTLGFSQADCGNALALTPGTPQVGDTTGQAGSFSDSDTAPEVNPCSTNYNDLEYWFQYTAVETGETLDITVSDLTSNYYGVFIIDNCPDSTPTCITSETNGFSAADLVVSTPALTAGTTYYIVLSDWIEGPTTFTMNSVLNAAPTCLAPTALAATGITSSSADLSWTENGTTALWNIEVVDITAGDTVTGDATEEGVTNPYTLSGLTANNAYEFYVQADCGGDTSAWVGPVAFFTGYCIPASTSTSTYTDGFEVTGALANTSTTATGYTGTGYADYYDTNTIESFDGGSFDFSATIVGGTAGYAIWVDWNNDLVFDAATETVYNTTGYGDGPFMGSIPVPGGTALGDYRLRTMVDWGDSNPNDDACAFAGARGEVEDYKITIVSAPADEMDFYNVQWVTDGTTGSDVSLTVEFGTSVTVYAKGYEAGVTDAPGQGAGVECWIAINDENTDPSTWDNALWEVATYEGDSGPSDDQYEYVTSNTSPGANYVAARWRLNNAAFTYGGFNGPWDGTNNVNIELIVEPLANDDCAGAIALTVNADSECTVTTSGTIESATASGEDESSCSGTENDDVWFSFVAAAESHIIDLLNVANGTADLYHSVWSGSCGTLTNLSCSDPNSSVVTGLTIGDTYLLRVNSWTSIPGQTTTFDVCIGTPPPPPANDECVNAETIVCGSQYVGDTTFATPESPDPGTCTTTAGTAGAVWYKFTGANSNDAAAAVGTEGDEVTLDLSASTFDTKIRVFEGVCGTLTCVSGDDDGGTGTRSLLTLPTTVGTEYYVLVHGWTSTAGEYTLDVSCVAPCTADAGTLTADATPVTLSAGTATISATANGDIFVPTDYDVTYVLTSGATLVIEAAAATPSFDVTTAGDYTIHTLVAETSDNTDPNFLDLSVITFGTTTGGDVLGIVTGAGLCASLDVAGAPITVLDECTADAGTLTADATSVTIASGTATISATANGDIVVPTDYDVTYVLTSGATLVIEAAAATPSFDVTTAGDYTIHTLVAETSDNTDPNFLDLSVITFGTTTGGDVLGIVTGAGLCASLDVAGAPITVLQDPLSIDDQEMAAFTYYPNPVKNTLTLNAQNTIEQVAMYNMLGQEVLRVTPNTVDSDLDMSNLQTGTYFVKVTIANTTKTIRVIKQ